MIRTGLPGGYPTARDAVFAAHDAHKSRTHETRVSDPDTTVVSPTVITTPTERRHDSMSTINIHHQGITLEWVIKDPAVAEKVMSALWAMITDSGAVPAAPTPVRRPRQAYRRITPEFLAEVARVYEAAPNNGKSRAVREAFGVSQPAASNSIQQARQLGLLGPSTTHSLNGRIPRTVESTLTDGVEAVAR